MEEKYIEKIIENEHRSKSNTKRLDNLENKTESIHELAIAVKEIATETKAMREEINKIDKRVLAIEDKPNKRIEKIFGYIISAIIGGFIGYIYIVLGMK